MEQQPQVQTPGTNQGQQLDPTALALSRAIRATETSMDGDYNSVTKEPNGTVSRGAYQFNENNFKNWAKQYGLDPNDFSPENQDHLMYLRIKGQLDNGLSQSEIAAIHNGAKIVNGKYQAINPDYVNKVKSNYLQATKGFNPTPYSTASIDYSGMTPTATTTAPQEDTLGQELLNRTNQAGSAIQRTIKGEINPLSGIIQTAGAVAGGVGDIVGKGLELIPGVKQLEGLLGQGIGALTKTPVGQSVAKSIQSFQQAHPELSDDIGAGFNIVTALPILDGLAALKEVGTDAISQGLKDIAIKGWSKDGTDMIANAGKQGLKLLDKDPEIASKIVKNGLTGTIKDGKLITLEDISKSKSIVGDLNSQVKDILAKPEFSTSSESGDMILNNILEKYPNSNFTTEDIIKNGKELTPQNSKLWDKLENNQATLSDINTLRSDLDRAVQSVYTKTTLPPIKKDIGANIAGVLREYVQTNAPETQPLFKNMIDHFNIQKALELINNKKIPRTGLVNKTISGIPGIGGFASYIENKLPGMSKMGIEKGILKRTAQGAVRQTGKQVTKKVAGLAVGTLAQKATK